MRGRDLVGFVKEAQQRVAEGVRLPPGVRMTWGGQFDNFTRARDRLLLVVPLALGIIFGMLFLMFGDVRTAVAVFAGAPFALIGGVLALWLRDLPFSIPAAVGFIAVAGVAVLNGVVMASEVRARLRPGAGSGDPVVAGAVTVLRPVLTTALVAAVGFFPMAFSSRAGAEVQRPLATVVIGGIISSTLLALAVLPVLLRLLVAREPTQETPSMKDETTQTEQTPPANEARGGTAGSPYLVVLVGSRAGEMFRIAKSATLIGRSPYADVRLEDDGVSRRHAVLISNAAGITLRDLRSANGTYCNGTRIADPVQLTNGDKISMGGTTVLKFTYQDALEEQFNRQLYESAVRDGLTGLYNRRYFDERLRAEMAYTLRHKAAFALMMADIDHFKRVNDEHGHQVGRFDAA